ncbi:hypothetical protein ACVME8_002975 [Bradyrhizobium diazoefficiens]
MLPLRPRLKNYRGSDPKKLGRVIERNKMAERVVEYVHRLIANNSADLQPYLYADIGRDLELSADHVEASIMYGGHNGITIGVTEQDRFALARYKDR